MPRYHNVDFQFLSAGADADESRGTVLVRNGEMVLEVEYPGQLPYVVRGKQHGSYFSGRHDGHPDEIRVSAKWIQLDDLFIGTWIEDGMEYMFNFRLPEFRDEEATKQDDHPPRERRGTPSGDRSKASRSRPNKALQPPSRARQKTKSPRR